jgi:hypothetical protein
MSANNQYPILTADLQVGFYYKLKSIKDIYFREALIKGIKKNKIADIDKELQLYVSDSALKKLATFSLRGETVFPLPILLQEDPFLLGYYRLLYGISQKEFYSKGPFGIFKSMEENGRLSQKAHNKLSDLCKSLIQTGESLVEQIDSFSLNMLNELQVLTVGPQLRGSKNNEYGQIAIQKTFSIIKDIVGPSVISSSPTTIEIKNDSGRIVEIKFSADPDIEIIEKLPTSSRGLLSIEVKGGKDLSNIHNRIGEAEKSHQKAKSRGYFEFMTIINTDFDYKLLHSESPTTSHFFNLDKITDKTNIEYQKFKEILSSIIGINI